MAEQMQQDNTEEVARVEKLDDAFKRHGQVVEKAKQEYDEAYERLISKMSAEHLEPFAKILLEQEGIVLDTETSMRSIQSQMRKHILTPWNTAWNEHVKDNITKLEMLKEHFKEFEGKDWKMYDKSVEERTLPLRMEYKLKCLHWLQKQTEHQRIKIEKLTAETDKRRLLIQQTADEAVKLGELISQVNSDAVKTELKDSFSNVLNASN